MKEADVIRSLRAVGKEKVVINEDKKNAVIAAMVQRDIPVRKKSSIGEFVLAQIGFVNKMVWFWQGVWILLFLFAVWKGKLFHVTNENLCILSMAPPLLLLLAVEEITKVYARSMLEIEYATKYSLKKVVMARMLIVGVVNGILLFGGILFAGERLNMKLIEVLVYSLTPLLLMTFLLLKMMTVWNGEQLHYAGISLYVFFLFIVIVGRGERFNIYQQELFGAWLLLFVCGLIAAIAQGRVLAKRLECFEMLAG